MDAKIAVFALTFALIGLAGDDSAAIMAKVADNVEKAAETRSRYVYHQVIRSSLVRANGQIARKERREYSVIPAPGTSEKKLTGFNGEYRQGGRMVSYSEPGFKYKGLDADGDLMRDLTRELTDSTDSRDGIPPSLFPLHKTALLSYDFKLNGQTEVDGRKTYRILFEPKVTSVCFVDEGCDASWKGEAWVDAEEFQPVRVQTDLAFKVPWGVRIFLGINLRRTGFSVRYVRVAENVWFPKTYGSEFQFQVLWGYKRTMTLSLESDGFRKTEVDSKIEFAPF